MLIFVSVSIAVMCHLASFSPRIALVVFWLINVKLVYAATDPTDLKVLNDFRNGLDNPEVLEWPVDGDDPCGTPKWPYIYCSGDRIAQIQVKGLGLRGKLPQNFNQLSMLSNIGLQRNKLYGALPSFSGLDQLRFAYLDYNEFDSIPSDFFHGLSSAEVLALDHNPLNETTGWSLPIELAKSVQLKNLSLTACNLVGPLPDFLGSLPSLSVLKLSYNRLSGKIPASFTQSLMQILWLNDQEKGGMSGPIDVIASMTSLTQLWLHGNQLSGTIPENIGALTSLKDLNLNRNKLVGLVPQSLTTMELEKLDLNNNLFMGPIPKFKIKDASYASNFFCQTNPGIPCAPRVNALLDFLSDVNYPENLVTEWSGNDPCAGPWFGLSCNPESGISLINLPRHNLSGTLSPSIASLDSVVEIRLSGNRLYGRIPEKYTELKSLRLLDLSGNNLEPPLPKFRDSVKIVLDGNTLLNHSRTPFLAPDISPDDNSSSSSASSEPSDSPKSSLSISYSSPPPAKVPSPQKSDKIYKFVKLVLFVFLVLAVIMAVVLSIYCCKKKKNKNKPNLESPCPKYSSGSENKIKIALSDTTTFSRLFTQSETSSGSRYSSGTEHSRAVDTKKLLISLQVLSKVTNNFAPENELGRGGFGTVYRGELYNGTRIAVKRMEAGVTSSKALDEFGSEIKVLSKVKHRHLVSLLGFSVELNERLLVYEYMPQGALSKHLFHWKANGMEPLSWKRRFSVALDVAKGMEYLHNLSGQIFIHRDLKSSNILLDDEFRAKVSDFGLVKLAPDGERSVATRLAGTFGYLAPEYAGK